jgi:hypothetical protein
MRCHERIIRAARAAVAVPLLAVVLGGCAKTPNRIYVETFNDPLAPKKYNTDFTEAYYAKAADGGLDLLLRWKQPTKADPTQEMEQVIHAHAFWTPVLGTTRAEASMINATLRFMILTPPTGVGYEGAGFITFKIDPKQRILDGQIESGELVPKQSVGGAKKPFGPARISGTIRAIESRRQILRLLQDAELNLRSP